MRGRVKESVLRNAQPALVRADRVIKTQPEEAHRVTLERLTVAMWLVRVNDDQSEKPGAEETHAPGFRWGPAGSAWTRSLL